MSTLGIDQDILEILIQGRKALNLWNVPLNGRSIRVGKDLHYLDESLIFGFLVLKDDNYGGELITFHCGEAEYTVQNGQVVRVQGAFCPKCGKSIKHECVK